MVKRKKSETSSSSSSSSSSSNDECCLYNKELNELKSTLKYWDDIFEVDDENEFMTTYVRMVLCGEALVDKYSWAIPSPQALNICKHFSPLIEIGCGKGYWSSLLLQKDVDIIAYDNIVNSDENWNKSIKKGTASILAKKEAKGRNLMLCYPDENSHLGVECLNNFNEDYIIHIGELIQSGCVVGGDQRPFGRTSSDEFQVELASKFHCVLQIRLPSFPVSRDCLTVWKRTDFIEVPAISGENNNEDDGSVDNNNLWASIPSEEVLPTDLSCKKYEFLLLKKEGFIK